MRLEKKNHKITTVNNNNHMNLESYASDNTRTVSNYDKKMMRFARKGMTCSNLEKAKTSNTTQNYYIRTVI